MMEKETLSKSLQLIQGITSKPIPLPILSHVLLATEGAALRLTVTDLETTVKVSTAGEVLAPGRVTLPLSEFVELVREAPAGPITVDGTEPSRISISAGGARYRVAGLPPADFPAPSELLAGGAAVEIPTDALQALLRSTHYAMSSDAGRYQIAGMLFEFGTQTLTVTATDKLRLALSRRPVETLTEPRSGIVPRKAIQQLRRLLPAGETAKLALTERALTFTMPGTALTTRLIEGRFPNYQQVIPTAHPIRVPLCRLPLLKSLRRVSVLVEGSPRAVALNLTPGTLQLSSAAPEFGEAKDTLLVEHTGEPLAVCANATYLLDALEALDADQVVMELKDPFSPILLHPENDQHTLAVIMPLRY